METFTIRMAPPVRAPRGQMHLGWRQALALAAVTALLLLVSDGALPRLTAARADHVPVTPPSAAPASDGKPSFDVDAAIERARHEVTPVPGEVGALEVRDPSYRARFDSTGFSYAPDGATTPFAVALTGIERGSQPVAVDMGAWGATGNVATRSVSEGIREQVTGRDSEIEWDVVLATRPTGTGPLTVRADLNGVVGKPTRADANTAWQLHLAGGGTVKLGETVIKDATGAELYRALPTITGGRIALTVPGRVLKTATYPLTVDPTVSQPVIVVTHNGVTDPSVASDGTSYLVVWTQNESNDFGIFGARVSGDGTFVQSVGLISNVTTGRADTKPDVAWNGSNYLVVWQFNFGTGDDDIYGQLVSRTGDLVGVPITLCDLTRLQQNPTVAAAGSTFYVTWQDARAGNFDIFGGRVTNAGVAPDEDGIAVVTDFRDETVPDVAWNGTNFLVAYQFALSGSDDDVQSHLVNSTAVPVGSTEILTGGPWREQAPTVGSSGSDYFVAWQDARNIPNTGFGWDIYGALVGPFGNETLGAIHVSGAPNDQTDPTVAYNGAYLVAWLDRRGLADDVYGSRVAKNGTVQDPNGFGIAATGTNETTPAVARGPGGKWAIDYDFFGGQRLEHRTAK